MDDINGNKLNWTKLEGNVIPAGTGVILNGPAGPHSFGISSEEADAIEDNLLQGSDEATMITDDDFKYYVLSTKTPGDASSIGFYYQVEGGNQVENGAHKAYLAIPVEQAGNITGFSIDLLTGIEDMQFTRTNGEAYTISGVRMKNGNLPKGLYIIDGKKTVIK